MKIKIEGDTPEQVYALLMLMAGGDYTHEAVANLSKTTIARRTVPKAAPDPAIRVTELSAAETDRDVVVVPAKGPSGLVKTTPVEQSPDLSDEGEPPAPSMVTLEDTGDFMPELLLSKPELTLALLSIYGKNERIKAADVYEQLKPQGFTQAQIRSRRTAMGDDGLLRIRGKRGPKSVTDRGRKFMADPRVQPLAEATFLAETADESVIAAAAANPPPAVTAPVAAAPVAAAPVAAAPGADLFGGGTPAPAAAPAPQPSPMKTSSAQNDGATLAAVTGAITSMFAGLAKEQKNDAVKKVKALLDEFGAPTAAAVKIADRAAFLDRLEALSTEITA